MTCLFFPSLVLVCIVMRPFKSRYRRFGVSVPLISTLNTRISLILCLTLSANYPLGLLVAAFFHISPMQSSLYHTLHIITQFPSPLHAPHLPAFPCPPSLLSFLSAFPPFKISKCPAFCASSFSVWPTSPHELLCLILFCAMSDAFFGLMTRAPGRGPDFEGLLLP